MAVVVCTHSTARDQVETRHPAGRWHTWVMRTGKGRWGPRALMLMGFIIFAVAAAAIAYPLWWNHRSETAGHGLLREHLLMRHQTSDTSRCTPSLPSRYSRGMHLVGILEIPSLGVRAPVLQGLSDPVLNVAAGHDPTSPWPGGPGESIIEAHDVSYFARISALKRGDRVIWVDACTEQTFRVVATEISAPQAEIFPPPDWAGSGADHLLSDERPLLDAGPFRRRGRYGVRRAPDHAPAEAYRPHPAPARPRSARPRRQGPHLAEQLHPAWSPVERPDTRRRPSSRAPPASTPRSLRSSPTSAPRRRSPPATPPGGTISPFPGCPCRWPGR